MLTPEQRQARRNYLGSSDSAAVAGLNPWKSARDVFFEKVCEVDDVFTSPAIEVGNVLEPALLAWAANELQYEITQNVMRVSPTQPILGAQHDALVVGHPVGIEAKTTGILWAPAVSEEWGEPGSEQVPQHVYCQVQHQMFVSDLEEVWIPALIGGRGLQLFRVRRREDVIQPIVAKDVEFWHAHILPRLEPGVGSVNLELVRRIKREEGKIQAVADQVFQAAHQARQARLAAEKFEEGVYAQLLAAMGDASIGMSKLGQLKITEVAVKEYVVKAHMQRRSYWKIF